MIVLVWNAAFVNLSNVSFLDFFDFSDKDMFAYYMVRIYGFFISVGYEYLLFPIIFIYKREQKLIYFMKVTLISIAPTLLFNTIGLQLCKRQEEYQYNSWFSSQSFTGYSKNILLILNVYAIIFTILMSVAKELGKVKGKEVVGTQLTEDSSFGPMVMEDEVYLPTRNVPEMKEEKELGLFTYKGDNASDILYGLFFSNFAYVDGSDVNTTYCLVKGCNYNSYVRAEYMEENFNLGSYQNFVALDSNFLDQQVWADDDSRVGMHDIDIELLAKLENNFGNLNFQTEDFDRIDNHYAIIGTKENYKKKSEWDSEVDFYLNNADVIGYILVKDGHYYYGNLQNLIPEELSMEIQAVLQ